MCTGCGVVFKSCVDFPLYYKHKKCTVCSPDQKLSRCPYDIIPEHFTKKNFMLALEILHKKKCFYPVFQAVFDEIDKLNKPSHVSQSTLQSKRKVKTPLVIHSTF